MQNLIQIRDQMGREVDFPRFPKRIVSLVPSQTELLFDLGVNDRLLGVTKFCIHPLSARKDKVIVGGTKKIRLDKIRELQPDLIIGNKEENTQDIVSQLGRFCPVWMSDIYNVEDAYAMILALGTLLGVQQKANDLVLSIKNGFRGLKIDKDLKVLYFVWNDPYMVAASNTFIDSILQHIGLENATAHLKRYPKLILEDIRKLQVDVIMLSSEPYPFREKHLKLFRRLLPNTKVILVDGEYFSWYGSRLLGAPKYFKSLTLS